MYSTCASTLIHKENYQQQQQHRNLYSLCVAATRLRMSWDSTAYHPIIMQLHRIISVSHPCGIFYTKSLETSQKSGSQKFVGKEK